MTEDNILSQIWLNKAKMSFIWYDRLQRTEPFALLTYSSHYNMAIKVTKQYLQKTKTMIILKKKIKKKIACSLKRKLRRKILQTLQYHATCTFEKPILLQEANQIIYIITPNRKIFHLQGDAAGTIQSQMSWFFLLHKLNWKTGIYNSHVKRETSSDKALECLSV